MNEPDQDHHDLAIVGVVLTITAFFVTVAGAFALGYWYAGVRLI